MHPRILRSPASTAALALLLALAPWGAAAAEDPPPSWRLPVSGARVLVPFEAPAHDYGPGHRGIDIGPVDDVVAAPADGVVAFAGTVVDRGVVSIDHGGGWVTSVEPVTPTVAPGDVVRAGDPIGRISEGGHAGPGSLHVGVRHDGEYVNPLALMGRVPRAVLLPCC